MHYWYDSNAKFVGLESWQEFFVVIQESIYLFLSWVLFDELDSNISFLFLEARGIFEYSEIGYHRMVKIDSQIEIITLISILRFS